MEPVDHDVAGVDPHHDELLTAAGVGELLRMSPAWVYEETRRRRIPHVCLGRYVRYRRSAVENWIGGLECQAGALAPVTRTRTRSADSGATGRGLAE